MTQRLDIHSIDPKAHQAVFALEPYVRDSGLDPQLYELVKIRASQLNGCAYCLDMHDRDARKGGADQRRLDVLSVWREAPDMFTKTERVALAFTEAVTRIADTGVPDNHLGRRRHAVRPDRHRRAAHSLSTVNVWNRLVVTTHQPLPDLSASS
jgi:AhpD family alkylhydroperoxidase